MKIEESRRSGTRLLDAGIVIAAVLVGFLLGRIAPDTTPAAREIAENRNIRSAKTEPIGKTLSLPGVDWAGNRRTLVLALQSECHFCWESAPFYKRLEEKRAQFGNTKFLAVLPQTVDQSKVFLSQLGISVDDIKQGSLTEMGVRGTPTLLLVNSVGVVTEAWAGKLSPVNEGSVISRLTIR